MVGMGGLGLESDKGLFFVLWLRGIYQRIVSAGLVKAAQSI